jgi:hypothetical protein
MSEELRTKEQRDAMCDAMRLTGQLQAAHQLVELIHVPHGNKRVKDLVDSANDLLRKAMLAAWEAQS